MSQGDEALLRRKIETSKGGFIGVDLDGTTFEWHGWTKWNEFGKPIAPMINRIKGWLLEGCEVKMFTARLPLDQDPYAEEICKASKERYTRLDMQEAIAMLMLEHVGKPLDSLNIKHYKMFEYWDDRAVGVVINTGQSLAEVHAAELAAVRGAP